MITYSNSEKSILDMILLLLIGTVSAFAFLFIPILFKDFIYKNSISIISLLISIFSYYSLALILSFHYSKSTLDFYKGHKFGCHISIAFLGLVVMFPISVYLTNYDFTVQLYVNIIILGIAGIIGYLIKNWYETSKKQKHNYHFTPEKPISHKEKK